MSETARRYIIALGSNRRHHRHGAPPRVLAAALAALAGEGIKLIAAAPVIPSAPIGPALRRYANGAAMVDFRGDPPALLAALKRIERSFGRRRGGQRWGARVLDLDLVLWQGGAWAAPGLIVPHPAFRDRGFVLGPLCVLAPRWRDPISGLTMTHLHARLTKPRPLPRARGHSAGP